jgi:carbonic anhydrase
LDFYKNVLKIDLEYKIESHNCSILIKTQPDFVIRGLKIDLLKKKETPLMFTKIYLFFALIMTCNTFAYSTEPPPSSTPPSQNRYEEAIKRLKEGNFRFKTDDQTICYDVNVLRRGELRNGQTPFATIVSCSDSRSSPEIVFDHGLGDLFVVRIAGNVVGPLELNSIEYAVLHLGSYLVVILGHENCGAVNAVVNGKTKDIEAIAQLIEPAVAQARKEPGEFSIEKAERANIMMTVKNLRETPVIKELLSQKKIQVVGAYYHFKTGVVEFL